MKLINFFGKIMPLVFFIIFMTSCGNDDVVLDDYLTGNWYSYKAEVMASGQSEKVNVSKTGQYSQFYYEVTFKDNNKVEFSYYQVDENSISKWTTETLSYSKNGDVVTIYDGTESIDFMFNAKDKSLYMRLADNTGKYGYITVFIYFRK